MNRREFIAVSTGVTAAFAGCLDPDNRDPGVDDTEDSDSPSSHVDRTEEYVSAWNTGDIATVNSLVHPESPDDSLPVEDEDRIVDGEERLAEVTISVRDVEVDHEASENVVVSGYVTIEDEGSEWLFDWREHDGSWLLWLTERPPFHRAAWPQGIGVTAPNAQIDFDYDADDNQLDIIHDGGDAITGDNTGALFVDSDNDVAEWHAGDGASGDDSSVIADESYSAGDSIATLTNVGSGDETDLNWESDDGDTSTTLGSFEAP